MNDKQLLICGLPGSGKSSFIAALSYLLTSEEVDTVYKLSCLPENRHYICELAEKWCQFVELERTPTDVFKEISLTLHNSEVTFDIYAPDMSGETWKTLWTGRSCDTTISGWANAADGILLFIHADTIRQPLEITTVNDMVGDVAPAADSLNLVWKSEEAPTAVILVDILQALSRVPLGNPLRRVAIIVSAWDKAESRQISPEKFVSQELPLLYQYLTCGADFEAFRIYGVSALGGELDSEQVTSIDVASHRIKVVESNSTDHSHDLMQPLQWLIENT